LNPFDQAIGLGLAKEYTASFIFFKGSVGTILANKMILLAWLEAAGNSVEIDVAIENRSTLGADFGHGANIKMSKVQEEGRGERVLGGRHGSVRKSLREQGAAEAAAQGGGWAKASPRLRKDDPTEGRGGMEQRGLAGKWALCEALRLFAAGWRLG
jgi:hypothetical protein